MQRAGRGGGASPSFSALDETAPLVESPRHTALPSTMHEQTTNHRRPGQADPSCMRQRVQKFPGRCRAAERGRRPPRGCRCARHPGRPWPERLRRSRRAVARIAEAGGVRVEMSFSTNATHYVAIAGKVMVSHPLASEGSPCSCAVSDPVPAGLPLPASDVSDSPRFTLFSDCILQHMATGRWRWCMPLHEQGDCGASSLAPHDPCSRPLVGRWMCLSRTARSLDARTIRPSFDVAGMCH